jgi:hypothetical protein
MILSCLLSGRTKISLLVLHEHCAPLSITSWPSSRKQILVESCGRWAPIMYLASRAPPQCYDAPLKNHRMYLQVRSIKPNNHWLRTHRFEKIFERLQSSLSVHTLMKILNDFIFVRKQNSFVYLAVAATVIIKMRCHLSLKNRHKIFLGGLANPTRMYLLPLS